MFGINHTMAGESDIPPDIVPEKSLRVMVC